MIEFQLLTDHNCSLNCHYCYGGRKRYRPMSEETMQQALVLALGTASDGLRLVVTGGEPLMDGGLLQRFSKCLKLARSVKSGPSQVEIIVESNGTTLNRPALDWLASQSNIKVRLSMDGPASVHDTHRVDSLGRGTHHRVLRAVHWIREWRIPLELVAVVDPYTVDSLARSVDYLCGLDADCLHIRANLSTRWSDDALNSFRLQLAEMTQRLTEARLRGVGVRIQPLASKMQRIAGTKPHTHDQVPFRQIAVAPSGRLYPSAVMVHEDPADSLSIGDVVLGIDQDRVAMLQRQLRESRAECAACPQRVPCQRADPALRFATKSSFSSITQQLCDFERSWSEAAQLLVECTACGEASHGTIGGSPRAKRAQSEPLQRHLSGNASATLAPRRSAAQAKAR